MFNRLITTRSQELAGSFTDPVVATGGRAAAEEAANAGRTVEVVSDYDVLLGLRPAWEKLLRQAGIGHPFVSHEWICTWWECFGAGNTLYVLLVWCAAELVAVAPLMLGEARMSGLRVRRLGALYNPHTPRFDFIIAPGHDDAYGVIWEYLRNHRTDWDVLELCQLPADSATLKRLETLARADGFGTGCWHAQGSPYLPVAGTWDTYWHGLRTKHRSNLRNRSKRLENLGVTELQVVSDSVEVPGALEEGLRIEAAAWKGAAGTAIAVLPDVARFYRRLGERAAQRCELQLHFLAVNERRIAFGYTLCYQNRLYLLKTGYDPAYAPYSPVNLMCSLVLRSAFERGLAEYDFLGTDEPWKLEWTDRVRGHRWLYVFGKRPRSVLLRNIKFRLVPMLKNARGYGKRLGMLCNFLHDKSVAI